MTRMSRAKTAGDQNGYAEMKTIWAIALRAAFVISPFR